VIRPKVILYSSLFPSPRRPLSGLFVSELVTALSTFADISVVAPVIANQHFKDFWKFPRKYFFSNRIEVWAPIVINIPKILKSTDGALMAAFSHSAFQQAKGRHADIVHAHFAYPDAVAARKLARRHHLPLIVTVHGSDINILAKDAGRQRQIVQMLKGAAGIVCVAEDLVRKVVALGAPASRVHHIPNGVDACKFYPGDKGAHRARLGLIHQQKLILTVGNLIPIKGYDCLIRALVDTDPNIGLVIAGEGRERDRLERYSRRLGLEKRVHFAGPVPHAQLAEYYRAADFLVISSHSEGWPTVILEALACGLPVIANRVGGIPEVLSSPELGMLMEDNNPSTIAEAIDSAYEKRWDRDRAVSFAGEHTWVEISRRYQDLYGQIIQYIAD
jgi:teichuronic acid biosynthesis glycosyltransferase TuaC